jgi:hypothetical protein
MIAGKPNQPMTGRATGIYRTMMLKLAWETLREINQGNDVAAERFQARPVSPPSRPKSRHASPVRKLVVFNGSRVGDKTLLKSAIRAKDELLGVAHRDAAMSFFDVATHGGLVRLSELRKLVAKLALRHPLAFAWQTLRHGSFYCGLIEVMGAWLRRTGVTELELFSSNSRFIEALRLAAITEGLQVTEFLHGVSVDQFGKFYDIIEELGRAHDAELVYVNMLPTLPQPPAVERKLLRRNGAEAFFRNERPWAPRGDEMTDLLIVGSGILEGDYLKSSFFETELAAIRECHARGLKVIYCPHPLERERTLPQLPANTAVGTVADSIGSARVVAGHFSTVIFTAQILGHNVLIFPGAWERLPENQASLFPDRARSTYSIDRVAEIVHELGPASPEPSLSVPGYRLA